MVGGDASKRSSLIGYFPEPDAGRHVDRTAATRVRGDDRVERDTDVRYETVMLDDVLAATTGRAEEKITL